MYQNTVSIKSTLAAKTEIGPSKSALHLKNFSKFDLRQISLVERWCYVALFACFSAIRVPEILAQGRFWAEEGQIFFVNAFHSPWYQALFFSYGGYLNITANAAGILARYLVPLKLAPYVTSIFALIFECFPAVIIAFSNRPWLKTRQALLLSLGVVLTLPASHELILSSIGTQVHLNLCVALLLVLETSNGLFGSFQKIILLLAPLSGPGGSFLIPVFFLRAYMDRSRERLIQVLILSVACVFQLAFFWRAQERVLGCDPLLFINIFFVKHLLVPFGGLLGTDLLSGVIRLNWDAGIVSKPIIFGTILAFSGWAFVLTRVKKAEPSWFFVCGLVLAGLAYFGALGNKVDLLLAQPGYRYAFAPQILFELSIVCVAFTSRGFLRNLSRAICAWLIVIALREYFVTPPVFREGPSWRSELKHWQRDSTYVPSLWPVHWKISVNEIKDSAWIESRK